MFVIVASLTIVIYNRSMFIEQAIGIYDDVKKVL